uniref:Mobilization protein MobD-like protein n=2 Tax=Gloeothece TaxID=28070 RepID=E0UMB0_GLOV7|nr:hypothetical protein Cyan7822_6290 [Gloeothece verrucosa PCC 7822]
MEGETYNNSGNISQEEKIQNLVIIGGEKGGTGKSYVCKHLIAYLIRHSTEEDKWLNRITVYDADPSVDDVYQIYQNYPWMLKLEFTDNKYRISESLEILESNIKPLVIINLPSNVQKNFDNAFEQFGLFQEEIQHKFYETTYFFFISDGSFQSTKLFLEHLKRYQGKNFIKTVLILNEGQNGQSDSFKYLESVDSKQAKSFLEEINRNKIPVLTFPELSPALRYQLEDSLSQGESFDNLINGGDKLTVLKRSNLNQYIKKIDLVFNLIIGNPEWIKYTELTESLNYKDNQLPIQK